MTLEPKAWQKILQCPQTGGSLVWLGTKRLGAINAAIARGEVQGSQGQEITSFVSAALHQRVRKSIACAGHRLRVLGLP